MQNRKLPVVVTALLVANFACPDGLFGYEFPLSEASIRSAYFLGKKQASMGSDFLASYTHSIPQLSVGSCISQADIQTPYAQVAIYASERSNYSAQQAIKDFSSRDLPVHIHLSICYKMNAPENALAVSIAQNRKNVLPLTQSSERYFPPSDEYVLSPCIGEQIDIMLPSRKIGPSDLKIRIDAPDGRSVEVVFDLDMLA
jgi:hypothetical protein